MPNWQERNAERLDDDELKKKATLPQRLQHFTWPWFACSMSTGALAVVIAQQPYTFHGLRAIGKIYFILDIVLFLCFTAAITYRFVQHPSKFLKSLSTPQEGLFFGSYWVTLALILNCIQQYGVPSSGPWLVKTLEVLFWTYAGCAIIVAVSQYSTLFIKQHTMVRSVMPTWIFPVYPFLVIGPLAAVLIPSQPHQSALNIWIGGIMFQGLGWCVSIFMYTVYIVRLMAGDLPPPSTRPGMFVSVGPAGYTSAALVSLATQAPNVVPTNFLGVQDVHVGATLQIVGVLAGIFVWLLSFWFCALTLVALAQDLRKMRFTLTWWAMVFPNAGMTLAVIQIGHALESHGIKAVASAMTIILVLAWFVVAIFHVHAVAGKHILWEGRDEDVEETDE